MDAVHDAYPDGAVPPIDAFKLDDDYFVLHGHKRLAAARAAGAEFVHADVTEISRGDVDRALSLGRRAATPRQRLTSQVWRFRVHT